jgi:hypothetical protein
MSSNRSPFARRLATHQGDPLDATSLSFMDRFAGPRHHTLSPRPDFSREVMPPRDASGALGRITLSDKAQPWLRCFTDRQFDDPDYSEWSDGPSMPSTFKLGANWTHTEHVYAADLVRQAFESGLLEHPDDLESVQIETPSSCGTYGRSHFTVEIEWRGRNRNLRVKSHIVMLAELDPGSTTHGVESALMLLRSVAELASGLLNDLAAEGVRTTDYWYDLQAETEAAADEASSRQPRSQRLRRWLLRNLAFRQARASTDFTARDPWLSPANSLALAQCSLLGIALEASGSPDLGDDPATRRTPRH